LASDVANRSPKVGDVVLQGFAADTELSVVEAGDAIAQSPQPGW
jgi:hypothetical protein